MRLVDPGASAALGWAAVQGNCFSRPRVHLRDGATLARKSDLAHMTRVKIPPLELLNPRLFLAATRRSRTLGTAPRQTQFNISERFFLSLFPLSLFPPLKSCFFGVSSNRHRRCFPHHRITVSPLCARHHSCPFVKSQCSTPCALPSSRALSVASRRAQFSSPSLPTARLVSRPPLPSPPKPKPLR